MLAAILPAAALVPAASTVVAVALPAIMADFGMGPAAIEWLVTGYLVAVAALQPAAGRLGDRRGHRAVLAAGTGLLAATSITGSFSLTPAALVASRLGQGVAGALVVPNGLALLRLYVPGARRGRAVGAFMAAMAAGALVGTVGGGLLVAWGGWQRAFLALGVLAAMALLPTVALPRTAPRVSATPPAERPLPPWSARWRELARPATGIGLVNLALYVVLLVVPLHLEGSGWSSAAVGGLLGGFVAAAASGALVEARVSRWQGRRRLLVAGTGAVAVALVTTALAPTALAWFLPGLLVAGAGLGLATSGLFTWGVGTTRPETAGATSGLLSTARYAGSIVGSGILPLVLAVSGHTGGLVTAALAALVAAAVLAPPLTPRRRASRRAVASSRPDRAGAPRR